MVKNVGNLKSNPTLRSVGDLILLLDLPRPETLVFASENRPFLFKFLI